MVNGVQKILEVGQLGGLVLLFEVIQFYGVFVNLVQGLAMFFEVDAVGVVAIAQLGRLFADGAVGV